MKKANKQAIQLIIATALLFVLFTMPFINKIYSSPTVTIKSLFTTKTMQLAKDPDDQKLTTPTDEEMIAGGAVAKSITTTKKKSYSLRLINKLTKLFKAAAELCAPVANIAGAVSPALTVFLAVFTWMRGRKKEDKDGGLPKQGLPIGPGNNGPVQN